MLRSGESRRHAPAAPPGVRRLKIKLLFVYMSMIWTDKCWVWWLQAANDRF